MHKCTIFLLLCEQGYVIIIQYHMPLFHHYNIIGYYLKSISGIYMPVSNSTTCVEDFCGLRLFEVR
jgi:hypothetical protein